MTSIQTSTGYYQAVIPDLLQKLIALNTLLLCQRYITIAVLMCGPNTRNLYYGRVMHIRL